MLNTALSTAEDDREPIHEITRNNTKVALV